MAEDGRTYDELVAGPAHRLVRIELDEANAPRRTAEAEHERAIAIFESDARAAAKARKAAARAGGTEAQVTAAGGGKKRKPNPKSGGPAPEAATAADQSDHCGALVCGGRGSG